MANLAPLAPEMNHLWPLVTQMEYSGIKRDQEFGAHTAARTFESDVPAGADPSRPGKQPISYAKYFCDVAAATKFSLRCSIDWLSAFTASSPCASTNA